MRLDKFLANMGFGSRKDVRQLIRKGHVTVNDQKEVDRRDHVNINTDVVKVDHEIVTYQKYIYIMLHKPDGYISATTDNHERTVIDLLPQDIQMFEPFPVGRLDKDTEGLLLITNDGKLAHFLTSPRQNVPKTYYAKIDGRVTEKDVQAFKDGVTLDDGYVTKTAHLNILSSGDMSEIELTITEGKFHQVKRMFLAVDKKVSYLKRIRMGDIHLDEQLEIGQYRELSAEEMAYCLLLKEGSRGSTH